MVGSCPVGGAESWRRHGVVLAVQYRRGWDQALRRSQAEECTSVMKHQQAGEVLSTLDDAELELA